MSALAVLHVAFEPDGVVFQFSRPEDVREPGLLLTQQLRVPATPEFEDLLEELDAATERALSEALSVFQEAPQFGTEEEDPRNPYDNPEER